MKDEYYIGIDNGSEGAISVINSNMKIIDVLKYPREKLKKLQDFLKPYNKNSFAVLERPFLGGKKHKGNEVTYEIFGTHKMNLQSLDIPFILAEPRINMKNCWRNQFNFESKDSKDLKKESISMVNLLFDGRADKYLRQPKKNIKSRVEYTKPDDNIAEALLLAEYGRRMQEDFSL
jgi:hypothetical protein